MIKTDKKWIIILRVIVFCLLFTILLSLLSAIVRPKNNSAKDGAQDRLANAMLAEEPDTLDVILFGNSTLYRGISPLEWWEQYGITAVNCGLSRGVMYQYYYFLKDVLMEQSPKLVILETDSFFVSKLNVTDFELVLDTTSSYYFPVMQYHNRWKNLKLTDFTAKVHFEHTDPYKGYVYSDEIKPAKTSSPTQTDESTNTLRLFYAKRIIQLCKERNIPILLFSSPVMSDKPNEEIQKFAEEEGVPFLDANVSNQVNVDWSTDTIDGGLHLNYAGAKKATDFLGQYIVEHYEMVDHRGDLQYANWQDAYDAYSLAITS